MMGAECNQGRTEVAAQVLVDEIADRHVKAERFTAQMLAGEPARGPVEVAERLLAIQGQDPRGARLAIRARTAGLTAADVDRALTEHRSLVISWLNRGTLHLVRTEDYWWLHSLLVRPQLQAAVGRRMSQIGLSASDADKGVAAVEAALASNGPLTRSQLGEVIASAGLPSEDNTPMHVIALASMRGVAVRGPVIGAQHAYVHVPDWLGKPPRALDLDVALAELARRYLSGHGPASDRDLAKWSGLPLGQVRRGLTAIAPELRDRPDGLAELAAAVPAEHLPSPRLLGAFDPVLLGWADRAPIVGKYQQIVTVNGLFRPFALVDGRAAATWSWSARQVVLSRFTELPEHVEAALTAEARDVQRFFEANRPGQVEQQ